MTDVLTELGRLTELDSDWDGYGAPSISSRAVMHALKFLHVVASAGVPRPDVIPTGLGRLQLEWRQGLIELDVEVGPDGQFEAAYRGPDGEDDWAGHLGGGVPPELALRVIRLTERDALAS
jgi:hypothetical protein